MTQKVSLVGKVWNKVARTLLKGSHRTRVLVVCNKEVLLTQDRINDGYWKLPGGGMKKDEDPKSCAVRELKEELGLIIKEKDLVFLKTISPSKDLPFHKEVLKVTLKKKPKLTIQRLELSKAEWFKISHLPDNSDEVIKEAVKLL